MKPEYVLLISAGGVFALLLLIYMITAIYQYRKNKRKQRAIIESYSDENIRRMDYDFAFSSDGSFGPLHAAEPGQVTIDEVLDATEIDANAAAARPVSDANFSKIENEGVEEITGTYKP